MKKFDEEISRILTDVYTNPIAGVEHVEKRKVVQTEARYIEYLVNLGLINKLPGGGGNKYSIRLLLKGYEVFEEYDGWEDYKNKVIDYQSNLEKSKELATKYWWVPIVISVVSIALSVFSIFIRK